MPLILVLVVCILTSCTSADFNSGFRSASSQTLTTYDKFLPLAAGGDPEFQNLVGFMHYYGEGARRDLIEAHGWFHIAAGAGHEVARRNDLLMHSRAHSRVRGVQGWRNGRPARERQARASVDIGVASGAPGIEQRGLTHIARGGRNYAAFCAGCHGLNGIAAYVGSPSFAINERLEKSDEALFRSVRNGIGNMPGWGGKLPDDDLIATIAFIRTLRSSYEAGISRSLRQAPQQYFLFGVMARDNSAYRLKDKP